MIGEQRGVHGQSDEPGYPSRRPHRCRGEIPALARPLWNGGYSERIRISNHSLHSHRGASYGLFRCRLRRRVRSARSERPRRGRRLRTVAVKSKILVRLCRPRWCQAANDCSMESAAEPRGGRARRSFWLRSIGMRERNWNGALAARSTAPLRSRITSSMPWHGPSGEWLTPRSRSVSFRARTRPSIDGCGGRRPTCA